MIKSPDEYTVVVETPRGPKDFQYDQVFTPDHGQEKVFEDTNVSTTVSIQMCCLRERLLIYLFTIRAQLFTENENDLRKQNSLEYFSPSYLCQIPLIVPDLLCYVSSNNLTVKCGQFCFEVSCHHIRKGEDRKLSLKENQLSNFYYRICRSVSALNFTLICNLFVVFFAFPESYPIGCGRVQCVYLCLWADRLWQNISF